MIRLALVGGGSDLDGYAQVAWRLRSANICAVVHSDEAVARRIADELGSSHVTGDVGQLIADYGDTVDAIAIHSAAGDHAPLAQQAAQAGKHVLVEAPLAHSAAAADAVIEAARAAEVVLMAGQYSRFLPAHIKVKDALDSGKLGEPSLLRIHRWEPAVGGSSGDMSLAHRVIREIDWANWIFGGLPNNVYAVADNRQAGNRSNNYFQVHLGFADGGMAITDYCSTMPNRSNYFSLSLIGSTGAAYSDDHHNTHLLFGKGGPQPVGSPLSGDHLLDQLQSFVDAIETGTQPMITGAEGRAVLQVSEAIDESLRAHRAMRLAGGQYELA